MDLIDDALAALYALGSRSSREIRVSDDAHAAAVDAYLAGGPGSKGHERQA